MILYRYSFCFVSVNANLVIYAKCNTYYCQDFSWFSIPQSTNFFKWMYNWVCFYFCLAVYGWCILEDKQKHHTKTQGCSCTEQCFGYLWNTHTCIGGICGKITSSTSEICFHCSRLRCTLFLHCFNHKIQYYSKQHANENELWGKCERRQFYVW